jgi:transposase
MHNPQSLFALALGLQDPWYVSDAKFSVSEHRLDLMLNFVEGSTFTCPVCGRAGAQTHDTRTKQWRHLNFFQHECYLTAPVPRVKCEAGCGVHMIELPWARPGSGFTLLFEAFVMTLARDMPVLAIAELVGEHDTLLWRILHHYVDQAREQTDSSTVKRVGIDETSSKRGHNYISTFMDLDASRLLFATEGKGKETIERFVEDLKAHHGKPEQILQVSCDLSKAFIAGVNQHLPHAEITFDRFHLTKIVNDAVDQVRRDESRENSVLKGTRYVWLRNPENLSKAQTEKLEHLSQMHLKTGRAYSIRLAFQDFFTQPDRASGEKHLKKWYFWATHSRLEPIMAAARTIKTHWDGVLSWFDSHISHGLLEGTNSLIQAAKARARGYRSTKNLITMAYVIAGQLNYGLPT